MRYTGLDTPSIISEGVTLIVLMLAFSPFAMLWLTFRETLAERAIDGMLLDESGIICQWQCLFRPSTIICGFAKKIKIFSRKTKMTANELHLGKSSDDASALVVIAYQLLKLEGKAA